MKLTMAWIVSGIVAVVLLIGLIVGGSYAGWWWSNHTANTRGNVQVHNQVNGNGSYRIQAYDHFFDLCATVQSDEGQILNVEQTAQGVTDPSLKAQYAADLLALRNDRITSINTYNADAEKSYTLGQFKSSKLPFQLDPTQENTTCHA